MKIFKIAIFMIILLMSISAVCAAENITDGLSDDSHEVLKATQEDISSVDDSNNAFKDLKNNISGSADSFQIRHDYTFNNETDNDYIKGIVIDKTNFTIEGNGFTIDGNGQSRIFNIIGTNITINNLVFKNGYAENGAAIYALGHITLNNVTFINNNATSYGGAILCAYSVIDCNNSNFIDNYAQTGSAMGLPASELNMHNTYITSKIPNKFAQIWV